MTRAIAHFTSSLSSRPTLPSQPNATKVQVPACLRLRPLPAVNLPVALRFITLNAAVLGTLCNWHCVHLATPLLDLQGQIYSGSGRGRWLVKYPTLCRTVLLHEGNRLVAPQSPNAEARATTKATSILMRRDSRLRTVQEAQGCNPWIKYLISVLCWFSRFTHPIDFTSELYTEGQSQFSAFSA